MRIPIYWKSYHVVPLPNTPSTHRLAREDPWRFRASVWQDLIGPAVRVAVLGVLAAGGMFLGRTLVGPHSQEADSGDFVLFLGGAWIGVSALLSALSFLYSAPFQLWSWERTIRLAKRHPRYADFRQANSDERVTVVDGVEIITDGRSPVVPWRGPDY